MKTKSFPAKLEHLHTMLTWLRNQFTGNHISAKELMQLELASEEALVNIIKYAHAGNIALSVNFTINKEMEITITDQGEMFNPLSFLPKNTNLPLEQREMGGLGIMMMKNLVDSVDYKRHNHQNILILKKILIGQ